MNVFVKPNEQSQACLNYAMARKGRMKSNGMNIVDYREYCLSLGEDVEEKLPFTAFHLACFTDGGHILRDIRHGRRMNKSCQPGRTHWLQHSTTITQSMGFPSCFIFSIRVLICSFFLSVTLSIVIKNCGQVANLPVAFRNSCWRTSQSQGQVSFFSSKSAWKEAFMSG